MSDEQEHDEAATPGVQRIDVHLQVPFGASKDFGHDWIAWARTADTPYVAGVDPNLNPTFHGDFEDGGTAYA